MEYTLIWQSPSLDVGIETYTANSLAEAITQWLDETEDCTLIGVLKGTVEVLEWYP